MTCNVVDDKGQTATSTTSVTVVSAARTGTGTEADRAEPLLDQLRPRTKRRPTRVDNEGKACLDDLALNLQRSTDSQALRCRRQLLPPVRRTVRSSPLSALSTRRTTW